MTPDTDGARFAFASVQLAANYRELFMADQVADVLIEAVAAVATAGTRPRPPRRAALRRG
ncbi:hypothetical protein AB0M83_36670 [Amycolatopsis sp. NPDC051106]|uniref:hypothetical protein n=1 Tax=unclassified Amycolatopsis TaxID=2618356 RepID=UPI003437834F